MKLRWSDRLFNNNDVVQRNASLARPLHISESDPVIKPFFSDRGLNTSDTFAEQSNICSADVRLLTDLMFEY